MVFLFNSLFNSTNSEQPRWDKAPVCFLLLFTLISKVLCVKDLKDYSHYYCKKFKYSLIFDFILINKTSLENWTMEKYFLFKVVRDSCAYSLPLVPHSFISFDLSFTLVSP